MTARCLFVCSGLLLFAHGLYGGVYQRTKDGQTLVWNDYPNPEDQASWSGKRDANGYAIGDGTLTWYRVGRVFQTGSLLPSQKNVFVAGYSGKMIRGKFNGPVINVDADGKTFHLTFVNGVRAGDEPRKTVNPDVPAEGPNPDSDQPPRKQKAVVEARIEGSPLPAAATPTPEPQLAMLAGPSIQVSPGSVPASPTSSPEAMDSAVRDRLIADFKDETRSVWSRVGEATGNFRGTDRLDAVKKLPAPVSESVGSLVDRARSFRSQLGYETALRECRAETETVDALAAVDQVTRSIASNNASEANDRLADFLTKNPEPTGDDQKALWHYLTSMRQLCSRLEQEANVHVQRAQSLAAASRPSEAIREYQEAYRVFPNPATAEKIRQLQDNSLGL